MANTPAPIDTSIPADPSTREPADGARDNSDAGISNRPIEEEQREQQNLPPRGRAKEEENA